MADISDIRNLHAPQRAYEYEVSILGGADRSIPVLTSRVESVSLPVVSVEPIEINHKSGKSFYAGRDASSHTITVNFFDGEDQQLYKFFRKWMVDIKGDNDGKNAVPRDQYIADLLVTTFAQNSVDVTNRNRYGFAFPTELGEVQLDYASSEVFKFSVTFSYDTDDTAQD